MIGGHRAPDRLIVTSVAGRGFALWLGTRLVVSAVLFFGKVDPLRITFGMASVVIALTTALGFVDLLRRHERILLGNLGVTWAAQAIMLAGPAAIGEAVVGLSRLLLG